MRKSLLTPLICLLALVVFVILFHWLFANRVRVELASGAAAALTFFGITALGTVLQVLLK